MGGSNSKTARNSPSKLEDSDFVSNNNGGFDEEGLVMLLFIFFHLLTNQIQFG